MIRSIQLLMARYKRPSHTFSLQTRTIFNCFFEAKQFITCLLWVPLYVQMLRLRTKANASSSITTAIGAMLPSSLPRVKFPNYKTQIPNSKSKTQNSSLKTRQSKFTLNYSYIKILITILSVILITQITKAQHVKVTASLEDTIYMIGQHIPVNLSVERNADVEVTWPFLVDSLGSFEVLKSGKIDTTIVDNKSIEKQQIFVTHFDSGYHVIPPVEFTYKEKRRTKTAKTEPFLIRMNTVEVDTTAAIMPIKNVIKMPLTFKEKLKRALIIAAVVLTILAIPAFLYFYFKRRKKEAYVPPPLPPYELAMKRLRELKEKKLWQEGNIKTYYSELTDILRGYIEGRFELPALEMTTDEISPLLKKKKEVSKGLFRNVIDLLTISDFVKFAKARPSTKYHTDAFDQVKDFVRSTKPIIIEEEVKA